MTAVHSGMDDVDGMSIYIESNFPYFSKKSCKHCPTYVHRRTSCKTLQSKNESAKQRNARQKEAETTSKKKEGREWDEYRSMHIV